jgi:hypothetical protein
VVAAEVAALATAAEAAVALQATAVAVLLALDMSG